MSFLDTIQNSFVGKTLDYLGGAFTHPIEFITNPTAAKNDYVASENLGLSGKISNAVKVVGTTLAAATALVGGAAALGSTSAKSIATSVFTNAVKPVATAALANPLKASAATVAALVGGGILTSSNKAANAAVNLPSSLVHYGSNIGSFVQDPSLKGAYNIFKDNPILASLTVAGAGLAAGTTLNTVATALNTRATNKNTSPPSDSSSTSSPALTPAVAAGTPAVSSAPAGTIAKKTKKKAKKKKKTTKKKKKAKKKSIKRRKATKKHGKSRKRKK